MEQLPLKLLNQNLIDTVAQQAANSERLRHNHNFHQWSEKVQRFINIMQPGSYVRPHCHSCDDHHNDFEFFIVLQGKIGILLFHENGAIQHQQTLGPDEQNYGMEIPEGIFHTLISLAPNTVIFELKEGPYTSTNDKVFLSEFPEEGTTEAQKQLQAWETRFAKSSKLSD